VVSQITILMTKVDTGQDMEPRHRQVVQVDHSVDTKEVVTVEAAIMEILVATTMDKTMEDTEAPALDEEEPEVVVVSEAAAALPVEVMDQEEEEAAAEDSVAAAEVMEVVVTVTEEVPATEAQTKSNPKIKFTSRVYHEIFRKMILQTFLDQLE